MVLFMPYRWPRAPVCCWICRGIHSYRRVTGSMVPATTSYHQGMDSMVPATMSYHRGTGSMMSAMTSYHRGMFCFPIAQGWAVVRTLVLDDHNTQVRRVLRVRSCSCDPTIAGIRRSSCQRLSKDAREILVRHQNIIKSDKLLRDTKDMLIGKDAREPIT